MTGRIGRLRPLTTGSSRPILLKKSVSERAACRQLKNRSISALLRKNQDSFRLLSEPDFNVANDLAWTKIAAGLFQQNRPIADLEERGTERPPITTTAGGTEQIRRFQPRRQLEAMPGTRPEWKSAETREE